MVKELIRHPWRWPVVWALVILALTSVPAADLPHASLFPEADKGVHFGLYAIFAFLSASAARVPREGDSRAKSTLVAIAIFIAIFAALDEWHQQFIPGRSMDVIDWAADVAGTCLGLLLFEMVRTRRERMT